MIAYIDRFFPVPSAELCDVRNRRGIQGSEGIFVERLDSLRQSNLDAIQKKIVLPQEVLLLNSCVQSRIVTFPDAHMTTADLTCARPGLQRDERFARPAGRCPSLSDLNSENFQMRS